MRKNNRRKTDRELDDTRVKMYKTHHGWVSCLTRFFHLLSFGSKEDVQAEQFIDKDSIKEQRAMSTDAYLKGLGLLSTLLGVGGYQQPYQRLCMPPTFLLTLIRKLLVRPRPPTLPATFNRAQPALHLTVIQRVSQIRLIVQALRHKHQTVIPGVPVARLATVVR